MNHIRTNPCNDAIFFLNVRKSSTTSFIVLKHDNDTKVHDFL